MTRTITTLGKQTMLVGVRYQFNLNSLVLDNEGILRNLIEQLSMRDGIGRTVVIDAPIIAGPIYLYRDYSFSENPRNLYALHASCHNCLVGSRHYNERSGGLRYVINWAHNHRCGVKSHKDFA